MTKRAIINKRERPGQRGDVAIYIAVVMLMIMLSATIVLSGILSRQIKLTIDAVDTEKAFYAADTALEEGRYGLSKLFLSSINLDEGGQIEYVDLRGVSEFATYGIAIGNDLEGNLCGQLEGRFRGFERRISVGETGCGI